MIGSQVQSIVFDWGGVISPAGTPDEVAVSLAKVLDTTPEKAAAGFAQYSEAFKRSKIDEAQFWQGLEVEFATTVAIKDRNIWTPVGSFRPDPLMLDFVFQLQEQGYDVSILSNTFPPTAEAIREAGWYDTFKTVILSSEVGLAKPEKVIYKMLLAKTGFTPGQTIFIDDQERCLTPAKEMGIKTVLAKEPTQIIADVKMLLV